MRRRGTTTPRGLGARGRVAVVVGSAVVLAGLGGCSGEPRPTPSVTWTAIYDTPWPGPEPTPTPTPTPTVPAPEPPAAMGEVSAAGAEAVARYFLDLYAYVYATGDLEAWRELSHPECIFCASVMEGVVSQQSAGKRTSGGALVVTTAQTVAVTPGSFYSVDIQGGQEPWEFRDSAGELLDSQEETVEHRYFLVVTREGDTWTVREVQVDDAPQ